MKMIYAEQRPNLLAIERRSNRRFPLQQSAIISSHGAGNCVLWGVTENASVGGVLIAADDCLMEGTPVEVTIVLKKGDSSLSTTNLRGSGRVLRVQQGSAGQYTLAIGYNRGLGQV
jgi:PilZ domain